MENIALGESVSSPETKRETTFTKIPAIVGNVFSGRSEGSCRWVSWSCRPLLLISLGDMQAGPVLSALHCFKPYFCPPEASVAAREGLGTCGRPWSNKTSHFNVFEV